MSRPEFPEFLAGGYRASALSHWFLLTLAPGLPPQDAEEGLVTSQPHVNSDKQARLSGRAWHPAATVTGGMT